MAGDERGHGPQTEGASVRMAISNAIVRIHAKYYGRGPTKARTYLHEDFAMTVLEDLFTPVERTLIGADQFERVMDIRNAFQDAMKEEFTATVEESSGRKVRAFISQVSVEPEVGTELFLFEPREAPR